MLNPTQKSHCFIYSSRIYVRVHLKQTINPIPPSSMDGRWSTWQSHGVLSMDGRWSTWQSHSVLSMDGRWSTWQSHGVLVLYIADAPAGGTNKRMILSWCHEVVAFRMSQKTAPFANIHSWGSTYYPYLIRELQGLFALCRRRPWLGSLSTVWVPRRHKNGFYFYNLGPKANYF